MKKTLVAIALIILIGAVAYHNCLNNEMFWDDDDFILKNRYIKDWQFFPQFFSENLVAGGYLLSNYWRPLLLTVFAFAWRLWPANPPGTKLLWLPGWHGLNIAFHVLDGILLYFLLNRLFKNPVLSIVAALIFVAHPTHNEAIVYVNSLGDSLATFFVLASLLLFTRFRQSASAQLLSHSATANRLNKPAWQSRNYWFSLLCYPLALMSKETGFVLFGLMLAMDILLLQKDRAFFTRARKTISTVWPFIAAAAIYIILRATALNFNNSFNFYNADNEFSSNIFLRLLTFFKAMTQYAGFLFFPYELRVERQMPWAQSLWQWDVLVGGLLVAFMVYAIFKFWRTKPWVSFSFAWFFIAIAPASNVLVPINAVLYEHFLYMPMIGIALVVSNTVIRALHTKTLQKSAAVVFVLVIVAFCAINIRRNVDWRTAIGFYEQLVKYSPNYRVINNLGMEYANKGFNDKAEYWYNQAIALDLMNPVGYHNIAGTYRDTGRIKLAEDNFKKAIALNQNFIFSYRSLADLYYRLGNYSESKKYMEVLVNFDPQDQAAKAGLDMVNKLVGN